MTRVGEHDGFVRVHELPTGDAAKAAGASSAHCQSVRQIRKTYLGVTKETKNQIERESKILDAYRDYRGALKHAEVMALEVLKKADEKLESVGGLEGGQRQGGGFRRYRARRAGQARAHYATSICAGRRTRRSATRSPRTSPTT